MNKIELRTDDGQCPAYTFPPAGSGPWPGVLMFMDGVGIRPAMFEMGERLAKGGYFVLMPDLYYRAGPYAPMDAKTVFTDPAKRDELRSRFMATTTVPNVMRDVRAYLDFLATNPNVKKPAGGQPKFGATGYCMGGRLSMCAAGTYPDRFAAVAAYHPGGLVSDAPDSPHLLAPKMKAKIYVGGASEDPSFTAEQQKKFDEALTAAKVDHVLETYPARHGWVPTDMPMYDPAQAEKHWKTLLDLFDRTLKA